MSVSRFLLLSVSFIALGAVSACSGGVKGVRDSLGISKDAPDEFSVVKRAPLEMPADASQLPPPRPGAPRPQEQAMESKARATVLGSGEVPTAPSEGETLLLRQAGSDKVPADIRQTIDSETVKLNETNKPVVKRLLGIGKDDVTGSVVNAKEEAERLKKNAQEGKPVTEGETPVVE